MSPADAGFFSSRVMSEKIEITEGREFGLAVCEYLGLTPNRVTDVRMLSDANEILSIEITHLIDKQGLRAIADKMK